MQRKKKSRGSRERAPASQRRKEEPAPASQRRKKEPAPPVESRDTYAAEPFRADRPSMEELGGLSEYEATAASASENLDEDGDPLRPMSGVPVDADAEDDDEGTVSPDDLGRHFLKGAVQDPHPIDPVGDDMLANTHEEASSIEFDEIESTDPDDLEDEPVPLTTYLEDGSEHEREISEKALAEVRRRVRRRKQAGKPPHMR